MIQVHRPVATLSTPIRYAVHGGLSPDLRPGLLAGSSVRRGVVPWLCPECRGIVAATVLDHVTDHYQTARTVLPFESAHYIAADRDGIPYFGPSRRIFRGAMAKSLTQKESAALKAVATGAFSQADYAAALGAMPFDTVCLSCPLRVRVTV